MSARDGRLADALPGLLASVCDHLSAGVRNRLPARVRAVGGVRTLALLATLALVGAFVAVMYGIADVAGRPWQFLAVVGATLVVATLLAGTLSESRAIALAAGLLAVGLTWYLLSLSYIPRPGPIVRSNLALTTGQSLHQIRQSGIWVVGVVPTPVFVTWYLALRRYYGLATLVGGAMLGYLVMTSDATPTLTLLGMVGAAGMLGFGDLDRWGSDAVGAEHVAVVLAVMVAVGLLVPLVPAGTASPVGSGDGSGTTTLETALLEDTSEVTPGSGVDLSPEVRFTIDSPVGRYWKATSYDRYTGERWFRTGDSVPLAQTSLPYPPGQRRTIRQTVEVESRLTTLPAAWRPVAVGGDVADRTVVTADDDLLVTETLETNDTYAITSAVLVNRARQLRGADAIYPARVRDRYADLPSSTPDRVERRTDEITAPARTPYQTAVLIEQHLESNYNYSLSVDRPEGAVADSFLFEMDAGYCTYFATTMAVMLRTQDIPARLATGYTSGEQVEEDRWVVRGLDAHAWIEVYVDDLGWVTFDPTPAGPRRDAERTRLETARENNVSGVDTAETGEDVTRDGEDSNTAPESDGSDTNVSDAVGEVGPNISVPNPDPVVDGPADGGGGPSLPPREHVVLGLVLVAGAVAGLRRLGAGRWLARTATVAWQPRVDPATDVERAFRRVSIVLERRHRPRRAGETVRDWLAAIDAPEGARRVAAIRERARYGDGVDADLADDAVALADDLRTTDLGNVRASTRDGEGARRGPFR